MLAFMQCLAFLGEGYIPFEEVFKKRKIFTLSLYCTCPLLQKQGIMGQEDNQEGLLLLTQLNVGLTDASGKSVRPSHRGQIMTCVTDRCMMLLFMKFYITSNHVFNMRQGLKSTTLILNKIFFKYPVCACLFLLQITRNIFFYFLEKKDNGLL